MSYRTQALLAADNDLMARVVACAATQKIAEPSAWVWTRQWVFSAEPGWDAAYAYALAANNERPGNDEGVITDAMILSAVQAVMALP